MPRSAGRPAEPFAGRTGDVPAGLRNHPRVGIGLLRTAEAGSGV